MSAATLSPPQPPTCLSRTDLSRGIKGGTLIAEDVVDLQEHQRRLVDPAGYRPDSCSNCRGRRHHAHCFRERILRPPSPDAAPIIISVRLFICVFCRAVFTVLPAFVARNLWRDWHTVESVTRDGVAAPATTRRRWLARLRSSARQLLDVVSANLRHALTDTLTRVRPTTRASFIDTSTPFLLGKAASYARVAQLIHRLEPGIRLM